MKKTNKKCTTPNGRSPSWLWALASTRASPGGAVGAALAGQWGACSPPRGRSGNFSQILNPAKGRGFVNGPPLASRVRSRISMEHSWGALGRLFVEKKQPRGRPDSRGRGAREVVRGGKSHARGERQAPGVESWPGRVRATRKAAKSPTPKGKPTNEVPLGRSFRAAAAHEVGASGRPKWGHQEKG